MSSAEALYGRLPVVVQGMLCHADGARVRVDRYGPGYLQVERDVRARDRWTSDDISTWRDDRLRAFIGHAFATVPHYRDLSRKLGVCSDDFVEIHDLEGLPVLTKDEVKADPARFVSEASRRIGRRRGHTSGTTGSGLQFETTRSALQEQWAVWWRYRAWHDIHRREWCGVFGGRVVVPLASGPPFWRESRPTRQIFFSGHHISPASTHAYAEEIRRRQLRWLHGYPSLLSLLASHVLDAGINLHGQLRWVTTGAERLTSAQREVIEAGFGAPVRQHYGMAEAVANASECIGGSLHVDEDFAALEIVDGRVVGTNLSNRRMPLIRYATGDLADFGEPCDCGRAGRVLGPVDGRVEDYITLSDGRKLGRLDHLFKDCIGLRAAQIRQAASGSITIAIEPSARWSPEDEAKLLAEVRRRIPAPNAVEIVHVTGLIEPGRKFRLVISDR